MIEEVKTDNNCIIRAFENNPISILKENIDDKHIYYFKASDIGKVLGIVNIRTSIMNFDEDEKVVRTTYSSNSGNPDIIFLTSGGVYRLLYNSKKEVAKKFRKWAGNILDDIIFNESAELKKQLKEKEEQLQLKENDLQSQKLLVKKKDKELKQMAKKISLDWLYVAVTDNVQGVSKIGITEEILKRIDGHLSSNPGFKYVFTYQSKNNKLIEKCIKALLDPFITNKNEWFNIESCDLIYIVEFFIELFDKNNGSEDPKLIIDFIKNISKKELPQEFICNELYDDFFETNMDIDSNGDKNYKCTLISIQREFEKYLKEHGFNKQIRANVKFLDVYTLDIKRYVKYKFNKTCERINIDDAKSNIHIGSTFGFCGFRMKRLYVDTYFDSAVYKNFIDKYLVITKTEHDEVSLSQILTVFDKYLKDNNINSKLVKQKNYFKTSFREELLKTIETFIGVKSIKRTNNSKRNGYSFFTGIKFIA
jgi:prophage antirepressor-like protein